MQKKVSSGRNVETNGTLQPMKKLIGFLSITCLTTVALAQGTVIFSNNSAFATTADRLVRAPGGAPLVGTDFVAQLYYGTQGTAPGSLVSVATANQQAGQEQQADLRP